MLGCLRSIRKAGLPPLFACRPAELKHAHRFHGHARVSSAVVAAFAGGWTRDRRRLDPTRQARGSRRQNALAAGQRFRTCTRPDSRTTAERSRPTKRRICLLRTTRMLPSWSLMAAFCRRISERAAPRLHQRSFLFVAALSRRGSRQLGHRERRSEDRRDHDVHRRRAGFRSDSLATRNDRLVKRKLRRNYAASRRDRRRPAGRNARAA